MTDTNRALLAADLILKGENIALSSDELESAMFSLAESQRTASESLAGAFARLARDRDSDIAKLYAAMDVRRVAERHARVLTKRSDNAAHVFAQAESNLDEFVKMNMQAGESRVAATARLAREDARFGALYGALTECRRLVAG